MIYINGRFLTQPLYGVNRFAYEITCGLIDWGLDLTVICPRQELNSAYDITKFPIIRYGFSKSHIWEQFSLPFFFIGKQDYLLINFTGLGPISISKKFVTIHDLAFVENPSWYSKTYVLLYKYLTPLSVKTSKHVLTVSNFSKKEIVNRLGTAENRISVIYNAADVNNVENDNILRELPSKYVLAVSSIDPRKNFDRLVRAFSLIPNINLMVVGGGCHVFNNVKIDTSLPNVKFLGRVSDAELTSLYKHATAFVYPSLYEGFGIPPIEAMTYGCPVVASDIEVLHEVCADAAVYVNPYEEENIAKTIEMVCNDKDTQNELRKKGFDNIKRFNWKKSAIVLRDTIERYAK